MPTLNKAVVNGRAISAMHIGGTKVWSVARQSKIRVHIDSDIDTVGERDDISAMALWLATQDLMEIVGLTASSPDSNSAAYTECIAAYAADRQFLIDSGKSATDFKTQAQLNALVVQGVKTDNPSRGYWLSGETGYNAAHAAAQLMISNALAYGDPSGDASRKLWIAVQGGYTTLAQAAYEAVVLGQCPDFFDRVRVIGQPNWNSSWAPNAWNYLFLNAWTGPSTPGIFHNMWMLCGYLQWHAFNRDNGGSDTTFWNNITANSATGDYLRSTLTRPGGAFTTPHFRAGDAGIWFWLMSAIENDSFDPEDAANACGKYRTYVGVNPWPSQTVGYGAGSGTGSVPNPEGVTWSPTIWAPELTVDSFNDAYLAVNLTKWYTLVAETMAIYQDTGGVVEPVVGLIGEWLFDEGTGSVAYDKTGNGLNANFGFSSASESGAEPAWVAEGIEFTPSQIATVDDNAAFEVTDLTIVVIAKPDTLTGDKMLVVRSGVESPSATGNNVFQFRIKDGALQFLGFNGGTVNISGGTVSAGQWHTFTAQVIGTAVTVRLDGVQVASGVLNAPLDLTKNAQLRFGARKNANISTTLPADGFDGVMAYVALYQGLTSADLETAEQRAADQNANRG